VKQRVPRDRHPALQAGGSDGKVLVPAGPRLAFTFGFAPLEVEKGAPATPSPPPATP